MTPKKPKKKIDVGSEHEELIPDPEQFDTEEEVVPDEEITVKADPEEVTGKSTDEKVRELNNKYLRLYSDFDNYRKRTLKEKIDLSKTASADLITDLLPVLDDFERAIQAYADAGNADQSLNDGVILIFNKFLNILTQKGLQQMKTIGEPFDTDFHEAITTIPAPAPDMNGKVLDEIEKGYMLHDKVIRYAKVVVGK